MIYKVCNCYHYRLLITHYVYLYVRKSSLLMWDPLYSPCTNFLITAPSGDPQERCNWFTGMKKYRTQERDDKIRSFGSLTMYEVSMLVRWIMSMIISCQTMCDSAIQVRCRMLMLKAWGLRSRKNISLTMDTIIGEKKCMHKFELSWDCLVRISYLAAGVTGYLEWLQACVAYAFWKHICLGACNLRYRCVLRSTQLYY